MSCLEFDISRRQLAIQHCNGSRTRRFALDPSKATWYSVYRSARLATRGMARPDVAAVAFALRAYLAQKDPEIPS